MEKGWSGVLLHTIMTGWVSEKWSQDRVDFSSGGLSSGWALVRVDFHPGGLHQGCLIRVVGLSSGFECQIT